MTHLKRGIGLPVLAVATLGNFALGRLIGRAGEPARGWWTALGVAANIGLLAFFKYGGLASPLGISFYTFGAVAYLQTRSAADTLAAKHGLFVIRATGSSAAISNSPTFKPKAF